MVSATSGVCNPPTLSLQVNSGPRYWRKGISAPSVLMPASVAGAAKLVPKSQILTVGFSAKLLTAMLSSCTIQQHRCLQSAHVLKLRIVTNPATQVQRIDASSMCARRLMQSCFDAANPTTSIGSPDTLELGHRGLACCASPACCTVQPLAGDSSRPRPSAAA